MMFRSRISIAVLAAVCLAVSCSSPGGDPPDIETVEQLVDAHDLAWINNDPEGVGAFYTDDGVFVDLAGFETVGRQEIVTYAEGHVALIPESRRTGPVEVEADGTYVFPAYLVVKDRGTWTGLIAVRIEDNLMARYDLTRLTRIEGT